VIGNLEREEQQFEAKLAALRAAIDEAMPAELRTAMHLLVSGKNSNFQTQTSQDAALTYAIRAKA
jgi:hypothetical protein